MMFLEVTSRIVDGVMVVDIKGELSRRASSLSNPLKELLADGRSSLILNLSAVSYVDSSGLGQLITVWTSIGKRGGQFILLGPSPQVRKQLEITKLDTVFTIIKDEAEAIRRIQKLASARTSLATGITWT
jgi:anti-sigma B factor antagonist